MSIEVLPNDCLVDNIGEIPQNAVYLLLACSAELSIEVFSIN